MDRTLPPPLAELRPLGPQPRRDLLPERVVPAPVPSSEARGEGKRDGGWARGDSPDVECYQLTAAERVGDGGAGGGVEADFPAAAREDGGLRAEAMGRTGQEEKGDG